jgi:hypothetical protein
VVYKRIFRIRQIVCCVATLAILPVCAAAATSFSALRVLVQFQADYSARETINPWWYVFVDGLLILYYVGVYQWLRRERSPVPVVPQYTPPDRLSPAAMRYLLAGDSDRQTVAAVLLSLAARGIVSIQCLGNRYGIIKRVERLPFDLPPEEAAAFSVMFLQSGPLLDPAIPKGSFPVSPIEGATLNLLTAKIHSALRAAYEREYFTHNLLYCVPAVLLSLFFIVGNTMMPSPSVFTAFFILVGALLVGSTPYIRDLVRRRTHSQNEPRLLVLLLCYILSVAIFALVAKRYTNLYEFALVLAVILNLGVPSLLRTPTETGRLLLHQIGGYTEFLTRVEVDHLHRMQHTEWAPGASTQNLAYAVALDLPGAWEDYLANANCLPDASESSTGKPEPGRTEPQGSSRKDHRAVLSPLYWRSYLMIVAVAIVFDLLLPYGFESFRIFAIMVVGGLLALYATPLFRSK